LDEVVTEFLSAKPEERSNILKKAEEEASKLEGAAAGYVCCPKHASCVQGLLSLTYTSGNIICNFLLACLAFMEQ
jgi:hypothetical protein